MRRVVCWMLAAGLLIAPSLASGFGKRVAVQQGVVVVPTQPQALPPIFVDTVRDLAGRFFFTLDPSGPRFGIAPREASITDATVTELGNLEGKLTKSETRIDDLMKKAGLKKDEKTGGGGGGGANNPSPKLGQAPGPKN